MVQTCRPGPLVQVCTRYYVFDTTSILTQPVTVGSVGQSVRVSINQVEQKKSEFFFQFSLTDFLKILTDFSQHPSVDSAAFLLIFCVTLV
eukprot:g51775.t1